MSAMNEAEMAPVLPIIEPVPKPRIRTSVGKSSLQWRKKIWYAAEMANLPVIAKHITTQLGSEMLAYFTGS